MSCVIKDENGKPIYAEADNGKRSILFDDLNKQTPDIAEELYTIPVTEDFLEEVIKPKNIKVKKSIIGRNMAKMIDDVEGINKVKSLNDARYLESIGKTPLQIKKITGWERGVDRLWRYEIPDGSIDLTGVEINKIYNISQIIKDNYITKLYPDIKIVFKDEPFKGTEASYNRAKKTIEVQTRSLGNNNEPLVNNGRWDSQAVFSLISHELVHFAQQIEGFDGGGDLYSVFNRAKEIILEQNAQGKDDITSLKNVLKKDLKRNNRNIIEGVIEYLEEDSPSKKENLVSNLYQRITGETEARAVQKRMEYFDFDMSNSLISADFDVAPEDQLRVNEINKQLSFRKNLSSLISQLEKTRLTKKVNILSDRDIKSVLNKIETSTSTPNGFVYNGQVYLNKDKMSPNTSIHEFGHLYLDFLSQNNKDVYDAGLSLIEKNKKEAQSYIDFVNTNQPDLKEDSEDWKNEVLAQVIGDNGARLVGSNLKTWLQDFWNAVRDILGLSQYTAEQVSNMTLKQFGEAVSKDLLSGENLTGTFKSNGVTINYRPRMNPITNERLKGVELELINTPQNLRGQGRAKKALREFLLMTDREGQDVYLFASPRDKTTTEKRLINFYKSLGFTSDQFLPQEMVRKARNVNRTPKPIAAQFDKNGEVFAKDVYEYVDRKNAEGIRPTQEDRVNIIKMLDAQTPSSDALLERTRKAFYINGLFAPTMLTLTNNGYTKGEATNILSDLSLQARIKENIAKIQNLEEPISIDEVELPYNTISSMEPNFVGKYQQANPYIAQKQIVDTLGGIKGKNEFDSAVVENSMEVAKNDFKDLSQYTEITIKEVRPDGTITERKLNRTAEKFQETLTDPSNDELRKEIDYILNIPPDIAQTSQSEIADLLEELREKAVDIGLDLTDIGQKYTEKGIGELTRFLVALRTLNAQNLQNFAQVYDSFFDIDNETVETEKIKGATQTTEKIYNKQKTAFEMFAENGLLYQGNNLYKRTNNRKSLEETLDIMEKRPEMFPQEIFDGINMTNTAQVRDRIEKYTNEQVQEIETGDLFDADKLKVYFLNTVYFGTPTNIQENIKDVESIVSKEIDTQYLSTDFIADFNKQSLKEKIKGSQKYRDFYSNFNITKDGIEPINTDPLSIQIMEEYMDEDTRNYFSLKKDLNAFTQVEEPSYVDDILAERNRVINFPKSVPLYKGQFEQKSAHTIKVKNPMENFIRTRDGIYELTERNSTDGYYAKLPHNTSPYILITDMVPEIDVEMDSVENVKEPEVKIRNLYTKQEEQQINNELECG